MIKKFSYKLMLAIIALMVGTAANATVKLSVQPASAITPGSEVQFAVIVESEQDLSSVSFDVKFPKGITAISADKVNDRAKGKGWTINLTEAPGLPGYFRFGLTYISFTPEDAKYILKGTGSIATITALTADNVDNGAIELTNIQILDVNENEITDYEVVASEVSDAEVYPGTMNFSALTPSVNVYPGEVFPIEIALENDVALRAFQCHFSLPEGFDIVRNEDGDKFTASDRNPDAANYGVNYNVNVNDNVLSLFIPASDEIEAGSGLLFSFLVKAPEQMPETAEFSLKNFFGGSIKGQGAGYNFDTEVVVTINNQLILDYEAAKAAVADLQKAFDAAKAGIEEKFLDDLEEDINEIENDINGEQGLKAIANPEELNPDFSFADFEQAVADELEKIQALADKAADMKEKNDQHNTDLNGQIEDLQKALDAVKEKVDAFDPVPEAFDKEAKAIQDAIDDLTKAVKAAFDEGDLVDKTELPENTVAADTKNLDNYADAAKAADDLQAALDQAKEDMEDKFLDNLEEDIDAIQNAVNELEAAAKPEELADIFDKDVFDKAAEDVQKAIDKLNADAAAMKAANDKAYEDLMGEINPEIPNRFNEAKQNIKTACPDVAPEFFNSQEEGVPSRVDEIQNMIDELVDMVQRDFDNGDLEAESTIADEKKAILDAIDQLEADATAAQKKFDDNKNGYLALNKELDALKKGLEDAKKAIEEMENVTGEDFADEIKDIEDDIQALEDYLEERNANRELTLQSTLDAPDVTKKEVEDELAALNKAAAELNAARSFIAGDINKDGKVDTDDLALFINALSTNKLPGAGSEDFARYDANGNGVINIADAQAIFNLALYGNAEGKK